MRFFVCAAAAKYGTACNNDQAAISTCLGKLTDTDAQNKDKVCPYLAAGAKCVTSNCCSDTVYAKEFKDGYELASAFVTLVGANCGTIKCGSASSLSAPAMTSMAVAAVLVLVGKAF